MGFLDWIMHFLYLKANYNGLAVPKRHHLKLNAWTVNKTEDIDWLLANDFDYITTDEPELVFERLKHVNANKQRR